MSTELALAGVSAVLRDLLNDRIVNQNVSGLLGSTVTVTTLPPDRISTDGSEGPQLNLFLRRISPNLGWRNECLPARDGSGRDLANPPLALNLHYLISAHGSAELHAEILLGYAMQLLHENPVIARKAIATSLKEPVPDVDPNFVLPPALRALAGSGLQSQAEQLRITPEYLDSEELSKFWTATNAHFRPSAAYQVSVVLIQGTKPARVPLPVLSRQVDLRPDLLSTLPTLEAVVPAAGQPVVHLGTPVRLEGKNLGGLAPKILLSNDRWLVEEELDPTSAGGGFLELTIPVSPSADFPVGVYRVGARVQQSPPPSGPVDTNQLALTIAPLMTGLPITAALAGNVDATITVNFHPAVRQGQTVKLVIGQQELDPLPFVAPIGVLEFLFPQAPVGEYRARLRIDGIDSPLINRNPPPPGFLPAQVKIIP